MTGEFHDTGGEAQISGDFARHIEGDPTGSTDAVFVYGYDLGGIFGWKVHEAFGDEDGELVLDWFDPEDAEHDYFAEAAMEQMLAAAGFTETWDTEAYWARAYEAPARFGVEIVPHGSNVEPMFALVTKVIPARQDDVSGRLTVEPSWDDRLRAVLSVLGLTPTQRKAGWLRVHIRN